MIVDKEKQIRCLKQDLQTLAKMLDAITTLQSKDIISDDDIMVCLEALANQCKVISRNKDDKGNVRNRFGRVNYNNGNTNENRIEIDIFPRYLLLSSDEKTRVAKMMCLHWDSVFKLEFGILKSELIKVIDSYMKEHEKSSDFDDLRQQFSSFELPEKTWKNTPKLAAAIEMFTDLFCLGKIADPDIAQLLLSISSDANPIRASYAFARVLTILGEMSRHLSDYIRLALSSLFLSKMNKIRDQLGHVHYKTVKKARPELLAYKKEFLTIMPAWQLEVTRVLDELRSRMSGSDFLNRDVLSMMEQRVAGLESCMNKWMRKLSLVSPPDKLLIPEKANEFQRYALISLRITHLKSNEQKLSEELSKIKSAELSSPSQQTPLEKKICRTKAKIDELHAKADLTDDENKILSKALENLPKLQAQHNSQIAKKAKSARSHNEVQNELDALKNELTDLQGYFVIPKLLKYLKPQSTNGKPKVTLPANEKLHRLACGLESEITTLDQLMRDNADIKNRDLAVEHCLSAIGQYLRDMQDLKEALISELMITNRTVSSAISETVLTRNQRVMHDPYVDHTPHINFISKNVVMPLLKDVTAIKTIATVDYDEITADVKQHMAQNYYEIAFAYIRLRFHDKAAEYFKKVLVILSPEFVAKNTGVDAIDDITIIEIIDDLDALAISENIQDIEGRVFIQPIDKERLIERLVVSMNLAACYYELEKYDESKQLYKTVLEQCQRYDLCKENIIQFESLLAHYAIVCSECGSPADVIFNDTIGKLTLGSDIYLLFLINMAQKLMEMKKGDLLLPYLESINPMEITSKCHTVSFYQRYAEALLSDFMKRSFSDFNLCKELSEQILQNLIRAQNLFMEYHHEIKIERGDNAEVLESSIATDLKYMTKELASHIANQGSILLRTNPVLAGEFLFYALNIQEKYGHNTETTIYSLGESHLGKARLAKEIRTKKQNLAQAHKLYDQLIEHNDLSMRASAHFAKAQCFMLNEEFALEIRHNLEALAICEMLVDKSDDTLEEEQTAKSLLDELIQICLKDFKEVRRTFQSLLKEDEIKQNPIKKAHFERCLKLCDGYINPNNRFRLASDSPIANSEKLKTTLDKLLPGQSWQINLQESTCRCRFDDKNHLNRFIQHLKNHGVTPQQIEVKQMKTTSFMTLKTIDINLINKIPPFTQTDRVNCNSSTRKSINKRK